MSKVYESRLQEANATIDCLNDEINWLRKGVNAQVLRLQDDLCQAQMDL
jgi:hypothetical protein